jgi:hypothetical protein
MQTCKSTLELALKAQGGVEAYLYSFFKLIAWNEGGGGGHRHTTADVRPRKEERYLALEAGWASEPVCTGAENLAPTAIRSPDRQELSESLYKVSYPDPR